LTHNGRKLPPGDRELQILKNPTAVEAHRNAIELDRQNGRQPSGMAPGLRRSDLCELPRFWRQHHPQALETRGGQGRLLNKIIYDGIDMQKLLKKQYIRDRAADERGK